MTAQKKRDILSGVIVTALIVCAVAARAVTRGHRDAPYFLPVSLLRSFIYIGLMSWWGASLQRRIIQTQTRLYDLIERESAPQFARLEALLSALSDVPSLEEGKRLLGRIAVIMTYIKRRSNLVFLAAQKDTVDTNELLLCLNESAQALALCGVGCTVRLELEQELRAAQAVALYDLFGAVLDAGRSLSAMLLFIQQDGGAVRARISASCGEPLDGLCGRFGALTAEHDEDGLWHLTWTLREEPA